MITGRKNSEKITLYLNPYVKKFLQFRSLQENRPMSAIVNDEFAELLEDFEDIAEMQQHKSEPTISWEAIKRELDKKHAL